MGKGDATFLIFGDLNEFVQSSLNALVPVAIWSCAIGWILFSQAEIASTIVCFTVSGHIERASHSIGNVSEAIFL